VLPPRPGSPAQSGEAMSPQASHALAVAHAGSVMLVALLLLGYCDVTLLVSIQPRFCQ
jgi:hypothetical protein